MFCETYLRDFQRGNKKAAESIDVELMVFGVLMMMM